MYILGISCFYHDSAVCLLKDGEIYFAAQEERFSRKRHDSGFPENAVRAALKFAGIKLPDIDYVVFYDKPFIKFERIVETYLAYAPRGLSSFLMSIPLWLKEKLWMSILLKNELPDFPGKILFTEHHEAHAAGSFYPSPFARSAFITMDGVGEWTTASFGTGEGNKICILNEIRFPHSLGLLYSAFTYYTGFKVNSGEYKVMGLAPYGEPKYVRLIYDHLLDLKEDGSFKLNMEYFNYCCGLTMTNERFNNLFGGPPRTPETKLTQKEMDLAASIQQVTEDVMLKIARYVKTVTGEKNLCLAGGVALNCVGNGKILKENIFDNLWIQPASGDAGGALGAALSVWHSYLGKERTANQNDSQKGSLLGNSYSEKEIEEYLNKNSIPAVRMTEEDIIEKVADLLIAGKIIGFFQGRMEFGPRALGTRSIIGDARNPGMQALMNLKIKFREGFRPFAPSVLEEYVSDWFELEGKSPYMLLTAEVKKKHRKEMTAEEKKLWGIDKLNVLRSAIPAVTHVDYSARIQTVNEKDNPYYYRLIKKFYEKTGCPVIVNTSFNVRGEPIVCSPYDAYRCFMRTNIDYLVLGNYLLDKKAQPAWSEDAGWKKEYELD